MLPKIVIAIIDAASAVVAAAVVVVNADNDVVPLYAFPLPMLMPRLRLLMYIDVVVAYDDIAAANVVDASDVGDDGAAVVDDAAAEAG